MKRLALYPVMPQAQVGKETPIPIDHECQRCELHKREGLKHRCMNPEGQPGGVYLIAEMPGVVEDAQGRPFAGGSGQYLRQLVKRWWKGPVALDNATRCFPDRDVKEKHVDACRPYTTKVVREVNPQRIIALGNMAIYGIMGRRAPVMSVRRGYGWYWNEDADPIPVFYLIHPAAAMRNRFVGQAYEKDLEWALTCTLPKPTYKGSTLLVESKGDGAAAWGAIWGTDYVTYDVETAGRMGNPTSLEHHKAQQVIQAVKGKGMTFGIESITLLPRESSTAWTWTRAGLEDEEALYYLKNLLSKTPVVTQNGKYDDRAMLAYAGIDVAPTHGDTRLFRKLLDFESSASLDVLAELVGLGGHKEEAQTKIDAICKELRYQANPPAGRTPTGKQRKVHGPLFNILPADLDAVRDGEAPEAFAFRYLDDETLYRYNCLHADTSVVLADGRCMPIKKVVNGRLPVQVLSCSRDGRIEARQVTGWHKARRKNQQWMEVVVGGRWARTTPDHKWYSTPNKTCRADLLDEGDCVVVNEVELSSDERCAILGTLLGDSRLQVSPAHRALGIRGTIEAGWLCALDGGHAVESGLTDEKIRQLPVLRSGKIQPGKPAIINGKRTRRDQFAPYQSSQLHQLGDLGLLVYDSRGRRRLLSSTLDLLGPVGLAWWFMDDGCLQKKPKASHRQTVTLATNSFPREDVEAAVSWFRRNYGPAWAGKDRVLRLGPDASEKLCKQIMPYIFDCARYKIPDHIRRVHERDLQHGCRAFQAPVHSVTESVLRRRTRGDRFSAETRYCITVDENNNFFTPAGLVANSRDVFSTRAVFQVLQDQLRKEPDIHRVWTDIVKPANRAVRWIEHWGFAVDKGAMQSTAQFCKAKITAATVKLNKYGNVNPASPKQLQDFLFDKLKLQPTKRTETGQFSTDREVLEELAKQHPAVQHIMDIRTYGKLDGTYATGMQVHIREDGRIHASYLLDGAGSGRMSSSDPNMQNLPRADTPEGKMVRDCFLVPDGHILIEADQSQIELRVAAMLSNDRNMIADYKAGIDLHGNNARECCEVVWGIKREKWDKMTKEDRGPYRSQIKTVTFGKLYGKSDKGLAAEFNCDIKDIKKINDKIWGRYSRLTEWIQERIAESRRTGVTWTWWNGHRARRRNVWMIADKDEERALHGERMAYNSIVQGTAADFTTASLWPIVEHFLYEGLPAKVVATVHDSIVVEAHKTVQDEVIAHMRKVMTGHNSGGVPLVAEFKVGDTWGSMEEIKAA